MRTLISRWRDDAGGTYRTWFLWEERINNFRSIQRGIAQVVAEIEGGTFGNVYKRSSLKTVVGSVAEQRQLFLRPTKRQAFTPRFHGARSARGVFVE